MPKWTYSVTVHNALDRPLRLASRNIPYGKPDPHNLPSQIEAGKSGTYQIISPAGVPVGIEFYLNFHDVAPADQPIYGTVQISVDMPYWKHANKSSCVTTGILQQNGFQEVGNGAHNFSTSVIISKSR